MTGKAICLPASVFLNFRFKSIFSLLLLLFWPWQQWRQKGKGRLAWSGRAGSAGGQSMKKICLCPGWARDSSEQCLHEASVGTTQSLCFGWPFVLWGVRRILHRCRAVSSFFADRKTGWVSTKNEVPCDLSTGISCGWSGLRYFCK